MKSWREWFQPGGALIHLHHVIITLTIAIKVHEIVSTTSPLVLYDINY